MGNSVGAVVVVEIFMLPENFEEVLFSDGVGGWGVGTCVSCLTSCTCFQLRNISWVLTLSLLRAGFTFPSINVFVFYLLFSFTRSPCTQS